MKKHSLLRAAAMAPIATAGVYVLALRGRREHPAWETLRQYRYAHRGLHDKANGIPENSLAAFRRAVEHGFGAELDVHLTKDGQLAVIHDTSLLRTAGVDVKVTDLTAEELKQYRLEGTDEQIPLLEEVLPLFEGNAPLIVELKVDGNNGPLCETACYTLDQYSVDYCIESFHPGAVRWLKEHRPDICRGQLSENFIRSKGTGMGHFADFAMTYLLGNVATEPDFIAYNWRDREGLSPVLTRKLWGIQEVCWTVRDRETMERLEAQGSLIIFENFIP